MIGSYSLHFQWRHHRWTQMTKKQCPGHVSGTSHRHRPIFLEMGRLEIGWYFGNKTNKIPGHGKELHITDWSVFLGKLNKGNEQRHGGNASGTTKPMATHCHPYCTSGAQVIIQRLGTGSADGICPSLHRSWRPKNLGKFSNFQGMYWQPPGTTGRNDVLGQEK